MSRFENLPRRIKLTVQYGGWGTLARKSVRFVIGLTPLRRVFRTGDPLYDVRIQAKRWYRQSGVPVTVVIPTYGDPEMTARAVRSVRRTTRRRLVRIVVVDDGSPAGVRERLRRKVRGAELILNDDNVGFARNVNRVLRPLADESSGDVVLLNSDVVARRGWLESLQCAAHETSDTGIVGAKLLYEDRRIQFAGMYRNLEHPEWFDHRFRFKPADYGPATVSGPVLGVTGACMYIRADALNRVGALDDGYEMAFEDIDYCLRAWEQGFAVTYCAAAELTHLESHSRGIEQGERELASLGYFWRKWGDWFDHRRVMTPDGALRVVYVTEDTGVGGGHRDVFEHINRLGARGHDVQLYSLGGQPDWFDLGVPVRTFADYDQLVEELDREEAIKVATWWGTGQPVWLASVRRGIPVFFVQDIETSYYPDDVRAQQAVLSGYRPEFRYITISGWNADRLAELGLQASLVPPGIDLDTYRPLDIEGRNDVLLAIGRSLPLKNLDLTIVGWQAVREPRPQLWMFGLEPELGEKAGARYIEAPSDEQVNELMNQATAFIQTSRHEGFCLPLLEAMAAGTPVVSTDAHGNRDFCVDRKNCLMVADDPQSVRAALEELFGSPELRASLAAAGRETVAQYAWERRIDALEKIYLDLAQTAGVNDLAVRVPRRA